MEIFKKLESLGFFNWLDKEHNLRDTDMNPEYLDNLSLTDIHRTVANSMVFRWFREKYELFHSTNYQDDNSGPGSFDYEILDKRGKHQQDDDAPEFDTYEEAELACLEKLIEIVETKR